MLLLLCVRVFRTCCLLRFVSELRWVMCHDGFCSPAEKGSRTWRINLKITKLKEKKTPEKQNRKQTEKHETQKIPDTWTDSIRFLRKPGLRYLKKLRKAEPQRRALHLWKNTTYMYIYIYIYINNFILHRSSLFPKRYKYTKPNKIGFVSYKNLWLSLLFRFL